MPLPVMAALSSFSSRDTTFASGPTTGIFASLLSSSLMALVMSADNVVKVLRPFSEHDERSIGEIKAYVARSSSIPGTARSLASAGSSCD